jgi:hypothetical protein
MIVRIALFLVVLSALSGCANRRADTARLDAEREGGESRPGGEPKLVLPGFPHEPDLVEFFPGPLGSHRYFIDAKSLSVGKDGIVRYAVVVKTSGGATDVSYEGIRCASGERRIYATGNRDRTWLEARLSDWEPIRAGRPNEYRGILYSDYFCPDRAVLPDRETALRALRSGRRESEMHGSHL